LREKDNEQFDSVEHNEVNLMHLSLNWA